MAKPFSEETQGLLERAQLAIDRAARLRDQTRRSFREAQFKAFRLELTVGVSWAITLDVGGGAAGSVSAFMNTWGNVGSALAIIVIGYIVKYAGWNPAFFVLGVAALLAALMMTKVDPTRRLNV